MRAVSIPNKERWGKKTFPPVLQSINNCGYILHNQAKEPGRETK